MDTQDAGKLVWESAQKGLYYPYALQGRLTLEEAYRVQFEVLGRIVASGEQQAGWKIGLTADAVRAMFKSDTAVHGYLLRSNGFPSGHTFDFDQVLAPSIESELCFLVRKDLHGPGVTPGDVLDALDAVCPAFEVLERRGDMAADLPLGVADNVSQWAYVLGTPVKPYPKSLELGQVRAEVRCNGQVVASALGKEAIDNQVQSIAWLANSLAQLGRSLEAGQIVLTGSYHRPMPIAKGDRWETRFATVGNVSATFA
ncbi:MAG: 2-keto-4-pentenoate hydratase [SAR324 cluster bacterium]